jgi:hypothetical protein
MALPRDTGWKVAIIVSTVLIVASVAAIGVMVMRPAAHPSLGESRPKPIRISEERIHEERASPPIRVQGVYIQLTGGSAAATKRINAELSLAVRLAILSYRQEIAEETGSEPASLTDKYTVTIFNRRLLSVRYDFSVTPVPDKTFFLSPVTVTADLLTGHILTSADVFLPSALTKEGLGHLSALIIESAPGSDLCPGHPTDVLSLSRTQLDGDDRNVNVSFDDRTVDFTLKLPQLGRFPTACGHPTVHVPYCRLSGLLSPSFAGSAGDHTAYPTPATPVLGAAWASNLEGFGQSQPCAIYSGGDPTGLVTNIRWQSWGGATATGDGTALYAPGVISEGTHQPARVVAFKLGTCGSVRAYTAIEWFFPTYGETFETHTYMNACTGDLGGR